MEEGRKTLESGYYVVSMQIFERVVSLKPSMYEAWYLMGLSKYHLEDYEGAEQDCTEAIKWNPYIADIFDIRDMSRIREEKFDSAIVDYTHALELKPDNREYWFNRAYCYGRVGEKKIALQQLDYIISRWKNFAEANELRREIKSGKVLSFSKIKPSSPKSSLFSLDKELWQMNKQQNPSLPITIK